MKIRAKKSGLTVQNSPQMQESSFFYGRCAPVGVRLRSRSSYNAFELYRVRLTGTKMKLEIAKVFDLDGVRLKWSTSVLELPAGSGRPLADFQSSKFTLMGAGECKSNSP